MAIRKSSTAKKKTSRPAARKSTKKSPAKTKSRAVSRSTTRKATKKTATRKTASSRSTAVKRKTTTRKTTTKKTTARATTRKKSPAKKSPAKKQGKIDLFKLGQKQRPGKQGRFIEDEEFDFEEGSSKPQRGPQKRERESGLQEQRKNAGRQGFSYQSEEEDEDEFSMPGISRNPREEFNQNRPGAAFERTRQGTRGRYQSTEREQTRRGSQ